MTQRAGNASDARVDAAVAADLAEAVRTLRQVRDGDLRRRLDVRPASPLAPLAAVVNEIVDREQALHAELGRVAKAVGRDGRLAARIAPGPGAGAWQRTVDALNNMLDGLVLPMQESGQVVELLAEGKLREASASPLALQVDGRSLRGDLLRQVRGVNRLAAQQLRLHEAIDRMNRTSAGAGADGAASAVRAEVAGAAAAGGPRAGQFPGEWSTLVGSMEQTSHRFADQVHELLRVTTAVADGDLSRKVEGPAAGAMAELKATINSMVDQLSGFASEVIRVTRELGTEGQLGGQAVVPGADGIWRDLTDSVNSAARNLTAQVRDIAGVTTAVAEGDLSQKITVEVSGEMLELKETINSMVDQLSTFADEVTRVAREVGTEGKLGGQALVPGVGGTWKDLTNSVNSMASNLTSQVRNIAQVTTAVARGDLSEKIDVDARGEVLELKNTVNAMVDQLSAFASEVTRVAREVGTEGQLGGQATVPGVAGVWQELTSSVNSMASNLTSQVRNIALVTTAVARGDLSQKISVDARGEILQLKETVNTMVDQLSAFADEVTRVAREVGTDGQLGGQAHVRGVAGIWKDLTDTVNVMAYNLTSQVRGIAQVAIAVARGDLSEKIDVDARGEVLELKNTINAMVDQLSAFADEVTRVAREVGTEGRLGGQAKVPGVAGTWKDLTDTVNVMANNLTGQVRNIAMVTTAVARGDLSKKIDVDVRGEILELKTTINTMVDQLSAFASEVTRVAREVGTEGQLGGQATVPGVAGTWQRLTESVNQLAGNLTTQVRAIAEVATAVTRGDLTQQIDVDTSGEVAELKDNINQMIANLRETTRRNQDQDWLKGNLARISSLMQGQRDPSAVAQLIMAELTPVVDGQHGAFYLLENGRLRMLAGYGRAATAPDGVDVAFRLGDGLVGQVAAQRKPIHLTRVPAGYLRIGSGLGSADPASLIVLPVLFENQLLAVIEIASFEQFTEIQLAFLDQILESVGVTVKTIMANSVTEDLLAKSRQLTAQLEERSEELQSQQEELRRSNAELAEKAALLARQNKDIEVKNSEIEQARQALQERADQLALASKYKSEFLANMSHELRTPLNSLLILARLLADNSEGNLTGKQIEFAETIHGSGSDLLGLISDILDLSKIEAGRMDVQTSPIALSSLVEYVEATFRPLTAEKGLDFAVRLDPHAPGELHTDEQRLQQVLRNLLSNAAKFTAEGTVELTISVSEQVHVGDGDDIVTLPKAVAFEVADTGIGIAEEKLRIIFEAFQQADGTISRKYAGTGLGLSISREIAHLLGGAITVQSTLGRGSVFTLYLPMEPPIQAISVPRMRVPEQRGLLGVADDRPADGARATAVVTRSRDLGLDGMSRYPGRFDGEVVLVVDDDVRNVFALTSVLEQHGLSVRYAENGLEGIDMLERSDRIDLVLMDIMMPEMDGYTTMRAIRRMERFADLPIIALTAKAMQGDREKAIEAGASEYVTKPVVTGQLLDLIRLWLTASDGPGRVR
ncbi:HAMP domain-containing protein [Actinospica robiniae]|uniref:HAMP domain-containing protein n=1 Tax=Actinospica robiniae TaxID=304901 RepID=UPI000427F930|nr:HAMP domain-containing protein [Actinospica robiniae]